MKTLPGINLLFVAIAITSCLETTEKRTSPSETTISAAPKKNEKTRETMKQTPPKKVTFKLKNLGESDFGAPQTQVSLNVDGKQTILDTAMACEIIPANNFGQYDIPKDALSACGGWWAGGGDYYYVIVKNNKPVVYQGWQDEGQEDEGYHWKIRQ